MYVKETGFWRHGGALVCRAARSLPRAAVCLACACAFLMLVLLSPARALSAEKVHLAAFDYPPFYYKEDGQVHGVAVDIVHELFARLGMEADIEMYPLKRALSYLENGEKDGIMILIRTGERQRYIEFTDPVLQVRGLIWAAADRSGGPVEFDRLEDLLAHKIGVTRGYSYGSEFDRLLRKTTVSVADSNLSNFRMLLQHRIDIFPCNEVVAGGLFRQHPELADKFVHSEKAFIEWTLRMGVAKSSRLVGKIPEINKALAGMREEGIIDAAVADYLH